VRNKIPPQSHVPPFFLGKGSPPFANWGGKFKRRKPLNSFYDEMESIVRESWEEEHKRVIREALEVLVCFGLFMACVILMFLW
jgi:hypothetical protein